MPSMKIADPTLDRIATARSLLLEPYGLDEGKLARALGTIFEHRADYADRNARGIPLRLYR